MTKYYFLATALPDLHLGSKPDITFREFMILCKENMTKSDFEQVQILQGFYDMVNIRNFWQEEEIDPYGTMDMNQLEDALLTGQGFPLFVYDYLEAHPQKTDRLHNFPQLFATYFRFSIHKAKGFMKKYFSFERDLRLVLTAFRAKKLGRDISIELQYEDPEDPLIAQILAFKDAKTYEPPESYEDLKPLFEQYGDKPLELYEALIRYRFEKVESFHGVNVFSLERILGYMVQLILVENWLMLDQKRGREIVETIIKGTS